MELKHSDKGILSSVIALIAWSRVVLIYFFPREPELVGLTANSAHIPLQLVWFVAIFWDICLLLFPIGLGYGIAGLLEKDRKRLFAVFGFILNGALALLLLILLLCYAT